MREQKATIIDSIKPEIRILKEESGRIKLSFPYNPIFIEKVKAIKGRRWHPERKYWSFPPEEVTNSNLKDYLLYLAEEKRVSTSILNSAINALKFYYGIVLKHNFVYEIKRPKKDKRLPVILNQEEISELFSAVSNIKHRTILIKGGKDA